MLVSKTVRLPQELVEFVEQQEGADFTKKLVSLLDDVRAGDEERRKSISNYEQRMKALTERLDGYYGLIYDTRTVSRKYEDLLRQLQSELDRLTEAD